MLSHRFVRTAVETSRNNSLFLTLKAGARPYAPVAATAARGWSPGPSFGDRRSISVYGYTQAKALVYSQYGEPKDVLQ